MFPVFLAVTAHSITGVKIVASPLYAGLPAAQTSPGRIGGQDGCGVAQLLGAGGALVDQVLSDLTIKCSLISLLQLIAQSLEQRYWPHLCGTPSKCRTFWRTDVF